MHRLLLCAATLGFVAFEPLGRRTSSLVQTGLLGLVGSLSVFCFLGDSEPFYLLLVFLLALPFLPLPGKPTLSQVERALLTLVALTTLSFAVFFGEDRYHFLLTPVFALFAAGALRRATTESDLRPPRQGAA